MMLNSDKPFDQMTPLEQKLFALECACNDVDRAREILAFLKGEDADGKGAA